MKKQTVKNFKDLPRDYQSLCKMHLPRPIHDQAAYENTLEIIEAFAGFEEAMNKDQGDYLDLLADLAGDYEDKIADKSPKDSAQERLKYLLENASWSGADLGRFLGLDATMGNKILRGERKLTLDHVRKLSAEFRLQAAYFIE